MAQPTTSPDRRMSSWVESKNRPGNSAREVFVGNQDLVAGTDYDKIDVTYPSSTSEVFTYSLSASTILTITVTYLAVDKKDIASVVYS